MCLPWRLRVMSRHRIDRIASTVEYRRLIEYWRRTTVPPAFQAMSIASMHACASEGFSGLRFSRFNNCFFPAETLCFLDAHQDRRIHNDTSLRICATAAAM